MATLNISIPDNMKQWINTQIKSGKYSSASDYMRDLVRSDQRGFQELDDMLIAGLNSGETTPFDMQETKAKAQLRLQEHNSKKS